MIRYMLTDECVNWVSVFPCLELPEHAATFNDVLYYINLMHPDFPTMQAHDTQVVTLPVGLSTARYDQNYRHTIVATYCRVGDNGATTLQVQIHTHHVNHPDEVYRHTDYRILNRLELGLPEREKV